jgi:hypothetical protein
VIDTEFSSDSRFSFRSLRAQRSDVQKHASREYSKLQRVDSHRLHLTIRHAAQTGLKRPTSLSHHFVHSMCLGGFIKIRYWFTASRGRLLSGAYFGTSSDRFC